MLKYADYLTGKGIGIAEVGEVMLYSAFYLIPQIVPLSVLVASLIAFGTLGEHNELTAIKSAGVSLVKIIMPVFVFVLILSAALYKYNDVILPRTNIKVWSLLHDISQKKAPFSLKEGVFSSGLSGYSIKVEKRLDEGHTLKGIMIYQKSDKGQRNDRLVVADSGKMYNMHGERYLVLELFDGEEYREDIEIMKWGKNKNKPYLALAHSKFERSKIVIDMSELALQHTPEERFMGHKRMKTYSQLWDMADSLDRGYDRQINKMYKNLQPYYTYHFKTPNKNIVLDSFDFSRVDLNSKKVINSATQFGRSLVAASESFQATLRHYVWTSANFRIEAWSRYNFSFSCILLFLIGASIGAIVKKGGLGIPALISILIFIVYYILSSHGNKLAKELVVDVIPGMMLCNFVLAPVAVFCLVIAARDSGFSALNIMRVFPSASIMIEHRNEKISDADIKLDSDKMLYYINNLDYLYKHAKTWKEQKECEIFKEEALDYFSKGITSAELIERVNKIPKLDKGLETLKAYYSMKYLGGGYIGVPIFLSLLLPTLASFAISNINSLVYLMLTVYTCFGVYKSVIERSGRRKIYNVLFFFFGEIYYLIWIVRAFYIENDLKRRFKQAVESLKSIKILYEAEVN